MGLFSNMATATIAPESKQETSMFQNGDYISYSRRIPPGQKLKRTITSHNLSLFQCWFAVLRNSDGKVDTSSLVNRLTAAGIIRDNGDEATFLAACHSTYLTFDDFLDVLAVSKCYERSRVKDSVHDDKLVILPIAGKPTPRRRSVIEYLTGDNARRPSLLDALRNHRGGAVQGKSVVRTVSKERPKYRLSVPKYSPPVLASLFLSKIRKRKNAKVGM
jgi:hypothetical protein